MTIGHRSLLAGLCLTFSSMAAEKVIAPPAQFRADSTLVLIHVAVTDSHGRPIATLASEDFQVTENDRTQDIKYFSKEEAPISIAIVLDLSNSMANRIGALREAVARFLDAANPQDEFCLIELGDNARLVSGFSSARAAIDDRLAEAHAEGHTALLDGMYLGLEQLKKAHLARKALLVVSDGGDNHSRFSSREVRNWALESDAAIYAIETSRPSSMWDPEQNGLLAGLAEKTGGRQYLVDDMRDAAQAAEKIACEIRSQYVLGYVPADLRRDGKYQRVRVTVAPASGQPKPWVDWRRGYYAPENPGDSGFPPAFNRLR
jgi:Ca-activated chloride channel family protein